MDLIPDPYDPWLFGQAILLGLAAAGCEARQLLIRDEQTAGDTLHAAQLAKAGVILFAVGSAAAFLSEHPATGLIWFMLACRAGILRQRDTRAPQAAAAAEINAAIHNRFNEIGPPPGWQEPEGKQRA